ncbi:kinase-like domain-containing protein [Parasitella parasitica]|nr:kinase-like domain-containing protein [Parasitella parasitica]
MEHRSANSQHEVDQTASLLSTVDNGITITKTRRQTNNNDELIPAAEGLLRLREDDHHHMDHNEESLHSFRFSSSNTFSIREELLQKKKRLHGTLPGHCTSAELVKENRVKTKTVGSPVSSSAKTHFRKTTTLPPLAEIATTTTTTTIMTTTTPKRSMSNSSGQSTNTNGSTKSISTPPTTEDEYEEEGEEEEGEAYVPHLHNRLKQQNQAILTTYDDWRIILTNSIAQDVLVSHLHHKMNEEQKLILVGKSVMDLIQPSYQNRLKSIILKRRNELKRRDAESNGGGMVLVCGNVIPIIKLDGTKSSASLWLKEKVNESGSSVFIWIFEEVYESSITLTVDPHQGTIQSILCEQGVKDLYDYNADDIIGKPLTALVPSLDQSSWQDNVNKLRFFASQTKRGAQFPIIVRLLDEITVQITSMPVIAGLMTVRSNGIIEGCNDIFVKYLFGFSQQELVLKKNISQLLPQFPTLLGNLKRDDLLQQGLIINNIICRKLLPIPEQQQPMVSKRLLTHTPNNQPLPILVAVHRDGTPFEVQLQLKLVEASQHEEYALWISFDREIAFKRFGHHHLISQAPPEKEHRNNTHTVIMPPSENKRSPSVTSTSHGAQAASENSAKATDNAVAYSAQTKSTGIDDYVILDSLGQGAYGLVKLAVKRYDSSETKVVIKYVIKSRILVDCWTRDRKLGTVPVEIHILHTLTKFPHENLGDMLDYFEDEDHYYIVMGLHGAGMDLFDYIELNSHGIPESEIRRIFKQIALAVRHLHDHNIVHRDIKDENVVLDQQCGSLRLIDFGSAAYLKPGRKYETFVGTLDYAAPEILRGHTYSGKPQDVWALGILLFTLVYRENPFYDIDEIMGRELRIPFVLSEGSVDLISKMLERDVDKRIDIHKVLAHSWLQEEDTQP